MKRLLAWMVVISLLLLCACTKTETDPYRSALLQAAQTATSVRIQRTAGMGIYEKTIDDPDQARALAQAFYDSLGNAVVPEAIPSDYMGGGTWGVFFYAGDSYLLRIGSNVEDTQILLGLPDHRSEADPEIEARYHRSNLQTYETSAPGYLEEFCAGVLAEREE